MSEGSKERSPQQLAKSRRDYLAQVKMLSEPVAVREFVAQPPSLEDNLHYAVTLSSSHTLARSRLSS